MLRCRLRPTAGIVLLVTAAAGLAACSRQMSGLKESFEGGFNKPSNLFRTPDWAKGSNVNVNLGPKGPVKQEDLVSAGGQCAPAPAEPAAAAPAVPASPPPAAAANGTGFEGGLEPGGGAGPGTMPMVAGGIALGMTECQAVRRAGTPSNVQIGAGEGGERKVVLTYLSGPWPGIYTFAAGRLKVIDEVPEQEKPKPAPKKKRAKRAKSASTAKQMYVQ